MANPENKCEKCRYFADDLDTQVSGSCRISPPQAIILSEEDYTQHSAYWPEVSLSDWCGMFDAPTGTLNSSMMDFNRDIMKAIKDQM